MILIMGAPDEAHAAFIHQKLSSRGEPVAYLDTRLYPSESQLTFMPGSPGRGTYQPTARAPKINFSDVRSVYWRTFFGIHPKGIEDPFIREMAYREIESALGSFFRSLECLWVNSAEAVAQHKYKGYQLKLLQQAGLRVPDTLITNEPEAVQAFYECLNRQVIFKPVRGGAHTAKLTDSDLTLERLNELAKAPVQFQEWIPGTDIRVYLVGEDLFAAEIQTEATDFREDPDARIVRIELPEAIQQDCRTLASTLGLVFSGIDIRRTPEGEYVFLEGNPSPMFIYFEQISGYPISDRLVELLIRGVV